MSDLVGNPNCWFSHAQAHLKVAQSPLSRHIPLFLYIGTPYIRLVKFQLVRQIPDVYVSACVLAGKLFRCIFHRISNIFMVQSYGGLYFFNIHLKDQ